MHNVYSSPCYYYYYTANSLQLCRELHSLMYYMTLGNLKKRHPPSNLFIENPSRDLRPRANAGGAEKKHAFPASHLPRRQDFKRRESDGCPAGDRGSSVWGVVTWMPLVFLM